MGGSGEGLGPGGVEEGLEPHRVLHDPGEIPVQDGQEGRGGSIGLRDRGLLESGLERPGNRFHYGADADLASLAAAYGFGIARNYPFVDGNKRVAFQAMYLFLGFKLRMLYRYRRKSSGVDRMSLTIWRSSRGAITSREPRTGSWPMARLKSSGCQ